MKGGYVLLRKGIEKKVSNIFHVQRKRTRVFERRRRKPRRGKGKRENPFFCKPFI